MATVCCCSMVGTKSCAMCSNNPYADPTRHFSYYIRAEYACKFKENKPKTNADRIRAMSDEELTAFIFTTRLCDTVCPPIDDRGNICIKDCVKCVGNWLKQECDS